MFSITQVPDPVDSQMVELESPLLLALVRAHGAFDTERQGADIVWCCCPGKGEDEKSLIVIKRGLYVPHSVGVRSL